MTELVCPACSTTFQASAQEPWRCACGHPLEFNREFLPANSTPPRVLDRDRGLWAFDPFLPVDRKVTLGEGWTPHVDAPGWDATFVLEYVSPTGSFKDRGAAITLSRAIELGVECVIEDSSGNAGAAIAAYAGRAGIDATVFVPANATEAKRRAIQRTGADIISVDGSRADVSEACRERADDSPAWYASHAWNPAFLAGTATFAFELAARRDWVVPDAIVLPVGHGTLFLGAYRGFRRLADAGWIDEIPRLLGVQAAGVAPIVRELHGSDSVAETHGRNDLADGVQIERPVRRDEIIEGVAATDGDVISVDTDTTRRALERLHGTGFAVEPTSALAPAALGAYRDQGAIGPDDDVVVPLTGSIAT